MNYFIIFIFAFIVSLFLTPPVKYLAYKLKVLDHPDYRKIHQKPVPLMGGGAIFATFALVGLFFALDIKIIFIGLSFILFGLLDDAGIKIRARYKIWTHLLLSFLFLYLTKNCFDLFNISIINFILSACFITFMTNSMNMLDGMDGLVAGISAIASFTFFILGLTNNIPEVSCVALIVFGACLGFLRYNFNPASIFLGETGSTFLGYILAVMALKLNLFSLWNIALILNLPRLQFVSILVPLIILAIPIFDTSFVFLNRFAHKIKMSTPGKDHSHHRINLMGLSHKLTVLVLYAVQIVLSAIAIIMVNADILQFISLIAILLVFAASSWVFLVKVRVYN